MSRTHLVAGMIMTTLACTDRSAAGTSRPAVTEEPAQPADSLVATMAGGYEIWFTLARADSGAAGRCTDRAVEIRHQGRRTPVPLLYTSSAPEPVSDTSFRARLSHHCAPGDRYLVDLRTGRPVRER